GNDQPVNFAQIGIGGTNVGANIVLDQDILLNDPGAGGVNSFEINMSSPTQNIISLNGVVSGTGGLLKGTVNGAGTYLGMQGVLVLNNPNNSYLGNTTVLLGTLQAGTSGVIPDNSLIISAGTSQLEVGSA